MSVSAELRVLLADILFWSRRARTHLSDATPTRLATDAAKTDAVCWCLVCIGGAAYRLRQVDPGLLKTAYGFHLKHAISMRNRLAHGCDQADSDILWQTVGTSLPALEAEVVELLGSP